MRALIFFFVLALPYLVSCQNIIQLVVQTSYLDTSDCENDQCTVGISITNTDLLTCDIQSLDSGGSWDFQMGAAIGYEESQIGACLGFPMPEKNALVTLIHSGSDGWRPEYVRIILDDGTWFECPNEEGLGIDNDTFIELDCYAYPKKE